MSRKILLIAIICFFHKYNGFAQNRSAVRYAISTQPFQFLVRDVPVTIERVFKRHTLGLTLGYRFSSSRYENPTSQVAYYTEGYPASGFTAPRFRAITSGLSGKYFLDKVAAIYLEGQLFYRLWWYDTREYGQNKPDVEYRASARNHIAGAKLLIGRSFVGSGEKVKMISNVYIGLGYRARFLHEYGLVRNVDYYSYTRGPYQPFDRPEKHFTASFHLGVNFGFAFLPKDKTTP